MNRLISKLSILVITLFLVGIHPQNTYGKNEECRSAQSDAENYAYDLESNAKKLTRCASSEDASDLEYRAKRLQRCAGWMDFSDDCYTEFRRVKREYSAADVCDREYRRTNSAFIDYESAVSDVSSFCSE